MHSTASERENDPKLEEKEKRALRHLDYDTLACADAQETLDYLHRHHSIDKRAPWAREIWLWRHRDELIIPETMGGKCRCEVMIEDQRTNPKFKVLGKVELGGAKWRTGDFALSAQQQDVKYGGFWQAPRSRKPGDEDENALLNGIAPEQPPPRTEIVPTTPDEETEAQPATGKKRKPTLRIRTTSIIKKLASKLRSPASSSPPSKRQSHIAQPPPQERCQSAIESSPSPPEHCCRCAIDSCPPGRLPSIIVQKDIQDQALYPEEILCQTCRRSEERLCRPRPSLGSEVERRWARDWNRYWEQSESEEQSGSDEESKPEGRLSRSINRLRRTMFSKAQAIQKPGNSELRQVPPVTDFR